MLIVSIVYNNTVVVCLLYAVEYKSSSWCGQKFGYRTGGFNPLLLWILSIWFTYWYFPLLFI